jgi:hypothetical protein
MVGAQWWARNGGRSIRVPLGQTKGGPRCNHADHTFPEHTTMVPNLLPRVMGLPPCWDETEVL